MLAGKKEIQDRINELLDFVQITDLSKLSSGVKRKLAKKFEYIHEHNLYYDVNVEFTPQEIIQQTISLLPEIQQRLKGFVQEIMKHHDGPIDLPPFQKQLWTAKDGSFNITIFSLPIEKKDWKKMQTTDFPPDIPLVLNEFIDLLGMYPDTVIRRCKYTKCNRIFASVSAKEKFYHTNTCFYRDYNRLNRELQKAKLLGKRLPKD